MIDIPILLLAAGASSRMRGRDKLMEEVDGAPLVTRAARIALATGARVFVTLPPAPHPRHDALTGLPVTIVPVEAAAEGMGASIRTGISALPPESPAVMILLADLPDLTTDDLQTLLRMVDPSSGTSIWRGATEDGAPGHPIAFAACHFPALAQLAGDEGGRSVVKAAGPAVRLIPLPDRHALADLDTPEAWAAWRAARDR